jgi:hypothetical protein
VVKDNLLVVERAEGQLEGLAVGLLVATQKEVRPVEMLDKEDPLEEVLGV